jgi:two-component system, cell cycle sensor histidine kinase and response regulator CckA
MNLVMNASEAIGEQSGVVTIATGVKHFDRDVLKEMCLVEDLTEGEYVTLEVRDTGCGMDQATRERIFEPFFSTKFTGRGLGMSAVLGILRSHHGAIKVYSEPEKGAIVTLLFPVSKEACRNVLIEEAERGDEWRGTGTVLLVDDEEAVLNIGKRMLEIMGFSVVTAMDGIEALEAFARLSGEITCIILDLTMPQMSGEDAFEELHRIAPRLPIVISSGYSEQEVATRFLGREVFGLVQKPYRFSDLHQMLQRAVDPGSKGNETVRC